MKIHLLCYFTVASFFGEVTSAKLAGNKLLKSGSDSDAEVPNLRHRSLADDDFGVESDDFGVESDDFTPDPSTTSPTQEFPNDDSTPPPTPIGETETETGEVDGEFCWKHSFGRAVGTIPDACPADRDKRGLICYSKCPAGFSNAPGTVDFQQVCPEGWRDDGLLCRRAEYGRGVGYPAWDLARCESDNGVGNCEVNGLLIYPKCAAGFSAFGCCICRPDVPDCGALGFVGQLDLSCTKTIILGDPTLPGCGDGRENNGGLCYPPCAEGFAGIGPVCWGQPPPGWVNCGFGASPDDLTCTKIIVDQVLAVAETVEFVSTLGASSAIEKGTSDFDMLVLEFEKFKKQLEAIKTVVDVTSIANEVATIDPATAEPEDLVRLIFSITALLDPTGVSSIIAAYTFADCNNLLDNN